MANRFKLRRGTTTPAVGDLEIGELGLRTDTGDLYVKTDGSTVVLIGGAPGLVNNSDATWMTVSATEDILTTGKIETAGNIFSGNNFHLNDNSVLDWGDGSSFIIGNATTDVLALWNAGSAALTITGANGVFAGTVGASNLSGSNTGDEDKASIEAVLTGEISSHTHAGVVPSIYEYTATASQTTFTGVDDNGSTLAYTVGQIVVFLNGNALDDSDVTAVNGTSIVLAATAVNDIIKIIGFVSVGTVNFEKNVSQSETLQLIVGTSRWYPTSNITIQSVTASISTAPTGSSVLLDINKGGVSVLPSQLTIAAGANQATPLTPTTTDVSTSEYLTLDVDQIGSTIAGADLVVTIIYRK